MEERRAERRLITAVFIDVVGSTELTVSLGPERLKRSLDHAFAELRDIVVALGGTVEKYVGDAIFAIFGAPTAHADDPLRALLAAEGCLRMAQRRSERAMPFAVRVGVETGEALVDLRATEVERQQMAVGACVNIAARLQQLADPGVVLVGPTCREATADAAKFRALGEQELKGLGRLPVWQLIAAAAEQPRPALPFVGREAELEVLRLAFRRAATGRSVLVLVSGPPGQGKTRVVNELLDGLQLGATRLVARCRPEGETGALTPLRQLLAAGGVDGSTEALATRLADLIGDPVERRRVGDALAHSAGLRVSEELLALPVAERQDEITNGWRRYFAALARERPLVIWIEDLHWAEPELVRLVDRLTMAGDAPLLVVATARPEFAERAGLRPSGDRFFVDLDRLDATSAAALAASAGAEKQDETLRRAEGNPLFIIELSRARTTADLPLTLQGAIGARLDDLPTDDRELLQRAAVAGETFTAGDAAVLVSRDPATLASVLGRLGDLHYLQPMPRGYRFHHGLVRDVAYGRLPIAERLRLHARFAREAIHPEDAEALAYHWWEALRPPDAEWVWEGAAELPAMCREAFGALLAAGRRAADRFADERAIELYTRALALATGPAEEARVERAIADAHALARQGDAAWPHYSAARDAHRRAGEAPPADLYVDMLEIATFLAGAWHRKPSVEELTALCDEGEAAARGAADDLSLAKLLVARAWLTEDESAVQAAVAEALARIDAAADARPFVGVLSLIARQRTLMGDIRAAGALIEREDRLIAAGGRTHGETFHFPRFDYAFAAGDLEGATRLAERHGAEFAAAGPHIRTHTLGFRSSLAFARGGWAEVIDLGGQARRIADEHPATIFCVAIGTALAAAACAHLLAGRADEGRALVERWRQVVRQPGVEDRPLVLAYALDGRVADVLRIEGAQRNLRTALVVPPVALAILGRWEELEGWLDRLDALAARGHWLSGALAAALREERAARRDGGPAPKHAALRQRGHFGWSEVLARGR